MSSRRWSWLWVALSLMAGCRCGGGSTMGLAPARLVVNPTELSLPAVYVGRTAEGTVTVDNLGGQPSTVEVSVSAPFSVELTTLTLGPAESLAIAVKATPTTPGAVTGTLQIGELSVALSIAALEIPICTSDNVCASATFDETRGQCVTSLKPEGTTCENTCVIQGSCAAGTCVGAFRTCDDHDACTTDACDAAGGCSHQPVTCAPATDACHVSVCDAVSGCGVTEVVDGTLCGPDDCRSTTVDLCLRGQCTPRARPAEGRCANTWVPALVPGRYQGALAYDSDRQRVVLFGGMGQPVLQLRDTWEWDGTRWQLRTPAISPPPTYRPSMAYDHARRRTVMFTGDTAQTWEWDGTVWVQRVTTGPSPSGANVYVMAADSARRVIVLLANAYTGSNPPIETWEWNGSRWLQRTSTTVPTARNTTDRAAAYDPIRRRVVFRSGRAMWEWDGNDWHDVTPVSSASVGPEVPGPMSFDSARGQVVAVATATATTGLQRDGVWAWSGTAWVRVGPGPAGLASSEGASLVDDTARHEVLMFGGYPGADATTRRYAQGQWVNDGANASPMAASMSFSTDAGAVLAVMRGDGGTAATQVYAWSGTRWSGQPPSEPVAADGNPPLSAWFEPRQQLVQYVDSETWALSGTTWVHQTPAHEPPPRWGSALAYDAARQSVLLYGGYAGGGVDHADTWEWTGHDWLSLAASAGPLRTPRLVFDHARQTMVLTGRGDAGFETWSLRDAGWGPVVGPSPDLVMHWVAYDELRSVVVVFGWSAAGRETWEFDGATWHQQSPTESPPRPALSWPAAMTWDRANQRTILSVNGQTWLYLP